MTSSKEEYTTPSMYDDLREKYDLEIRFTKTARRQIHKITFYLKLGPSSGKSISGESSKFKSALESGVIDYSNSYQRMAAVDSFILIAGKVVLLEGIRTEQSVI